MSGSATCAQRAVTMGQIADILQARGQLDEALKIRNEEELPVYERLGDVRSRALTMGKIADILQDRGQLDEALKIRNEEELPVYERLGDVRSRAVTMGKIADILQDRGQLDEALKIRNEEQLPVYERLGDVRSRAVTMGKIAGILQARGQLDEALKIRNEEELPVYERLGDVRSRAVTMGQIADILQARGQLDEALNIYNEEELPVYERLGDVRSRAVTMGKIADILQTRGQLDEALKIRNEEQLPVYERLGDVRSRAVTMGYIADILQARGQLDEALKIRTDEELPVYERLGDVRSRAVTMGYIADILQARGQLDEALAMHFDRLAVADAMGDIDSIAHVKFCCAEIRLERGGWEKGEAHTIVAELAESFSIAQRIGRADAIAGIGAKFGQVLVMAGEPSEALDVLEQAAGAFETLQQTERAQQLRALQDEIRTILAESVEETPRDVQIEEPGPPLGIRMDMGAVARGQPDCGKGAAAHREAVRPGHPGRCRCRCRCIPPIERGLCGSRQPHHALCLKARPGGRGLALATQLPACGPDAAHSGVARHRHDQCDECRFDAAGPRLCRRGARRADRDARPYHLRRAAEREFGLRETQNEEGERYWLIGA